jgi:hypothetical protein
MSIRIPIDNLSYEQKYKVDNDLEIKIENSNKFGPKNSRSYDHKETHFQPLILSPLVVR